MPGALRARAFKLNEMLRGDVRWSVSPNRPSTTDPGSCGLRKKDGRGVDIGRRDFLSKRFALLRDIRDTGGPRGFVSSDSRFDEDGEIILAIRVNGNVSERGTSSYVPNFNS